MGFGGLTMHNLMHLVAGLVPLQLKQMTDDHILAVSESFN